VESLTGSKSDSQKAVNEESLLAALGLSETMEQVKENIYLYINKCFFLSRTMVVIYVIYNYTCVI
jgi:hypothetical protein